MRLPHPIALLALLVASLPAPAVLAQSPELTGLARATGDKHPLSCIRVVLADSSGREVAFARTDWRGLFAIAAPRAGIYRLRFESPMTSTILGPIDTVSDSAYVERVYELPFTLKDTIPGMIAEPGEGDLRPLITPGPHYPERLRDNGVSGAAVAEFVVDSSGAVDSSSIRIVRATQPEFGSAVTQALAKWLFQPQHDHGVAVCQRFIQPFAFEVRR